ncbi:class I SAM-dependent methyltransferase [Microbacterium sp. 4R-513]|uniref:class I SAM-dependent methyltransferase n=1 Tax=Microbacterium sp. 4R-513 TaxID=2567934 RepID=UPI0013E12493|nr:class I SAM-dependent methyltransferase [Microbacterium sp. 4R-513]QIG39687.1 class I SAM-dependent methyltransferase [Microbacterium sp. 4R-513]
MRDPMHFDAIADDYSAARPPYPPELWARVRDTGLVGPGRRALDLGAGTGQATGPLLAMGPDVTAVEPGHRLAALLRARHPGAEVVVARAEDLTPADASFDLAVAATSIHWMDLDVVLPAVHRALTADGRFLVWRNVFGDAEAPVTPFRRRVSQIVERRGETVSGGDPEDAAATAERLSRSGLFAVHEICQWRWSIALDSHEIDRLFRTFSNWSADEAREAADAVRELGGQVIEHYSSWLIELVPRRQPPPA